MEEKYKTFEEMKDELGDKLDKYMYEANIELLIKIDKVVRKLENSIESINKKLLDDKKIKVEDGRVVNMNDYQIVRLKAIRMKCKEILEMIERRIISVELLSKMLKFKVGDNSVSES